MVRLHLSISLFAGGYQPFSAVKGKPSINSKISIHNKYLEFIPQKFPSYPVAPKSCYILVVMCTLRSMSMPFRDPCASPPIHGTSLSLSLSTFVSGYWLPPPLWLLSNPMHSDAWFSHISRPRSSELPLCRWSFQLLRLLALPHLASWNMPLHFLLLGVLSISLEDTVPQPKLHGIAHAGAH